MHFLRNKAGGLVVLVPTHHANDASGKLVAQVCEEYKPSAVCVELCDCRLRRLFPLLDESKLDTPPCHSECTTYRVIFSFWFLLLSAYTQIFSPLVNLGAKRGSLGIDSTAGKVYAMTNPDVRLIPFDVCVGATFSRSVFGSLLQPFFSGSQHESSKNKDHITGIPLADILSRVSTSTFVYSAIKMDTNGFIAQLAKAAKQAEEDLHSSNTSSRFSSFQKERLQQQLQAYRHTFEGNPTEQDVRALREDYFAEVEGPENFFLKPVVDRDEVLSYNLYNLEDDVVVAQMGAGHIRGELLQFCVSGSFQADF